MMGDSFVRKRAGLTLLFASLAALVFAVAIVFRIGYWLSPPIEKFQQSWAEDIQLLEGSGKLPKEWKSIRSIKVEAANPPATDWSATALPPVQITSDGKYRLDVFVIHWLEGFRYGVVIQYNLIDLQTQNKIWELGRTLKLGIVY